MTKTKSGKFASPKGKPSGPARESSILNETNNNIDREHEKRIDDKYISDTENSESIVPEKHPNRNTDKGEENQGKE